MTIRILSLFCLLFLCGCQDSTHWENGNSCISKAAPNEVYKIVQYDDNEFKKTVAVYYAIEINNKTNVIKLPEGKEIYIGNNYHFQNFYLR
jgi:hypothetical protein